MFWAFPRFPQILRKHLLSAPGPVWTGYKCSGININCSQLHGSGPDPGWRSGSESDACVSGWEARGKLAHDPVIKGSETQQPRSPRSWEEDEGFFITLTLTWPTRHRYQLLTFIITYQHFNLSIYFSVKFSTFNTKYWNAL